MMVARRWPLPYCSARLARADELVSGEAAAEDGLAPTAERPDWLLGGDADVVAVDVVGDVFRGWGRHGLLGPTHLVSMNGADGAKYRGPSLRSGWIEFEAEFGFEGGEEGLGGPAVAHEEVLDAGAGAVFAELLLLAEDVGRQASRRRRGLVDWGMKAGMRTAMWGSVERPPPTRRV